MDERAAFNKDHSRTRLPPWFRAELSGGETFRETERLIGRHRLNTVCRSAACPNRAECWDSGTAAFLILGPVCTRKCGFCNVLKGSPAAPEGDEPGRVAAAVSALGLGYAVITSVTRDDLADGGAAMFAATISAIRKRSPGCRVEVLIPDFQGSFEALRTVLRAGPDVLNHNLETVPALYGRVRPGADYGRSLELLDRAKSAGCLTKTGIMLGLGEGTGEVRSVMNDLRKAGCDILTLGQYLQPNRAALPVRKYYCPEEFEELRKEGIFLGFRQVSAGPRVRSSYHAGQRDAERIEGTDGDCGDPEGSSSIRKDAV